MLRFVRLSALVTLLLTGCSPAAPLLQVGSQRVTVEDYERAALGAQAQYAGPPAVAKALLVDDLMRRAVMLELAHRLGHENDPVVVATTQKSARRMLVPMLYGRLAPAAQRVSEAEARSMYDARTQEAEVRMIHSPSREASLAALARVRSGEDFSAVSRAVSLPGLLPPDGNLGMVPPGSLPEPIDGAVRSLPAGQVAGPFQVREGWFLVKIGKRQPRQQVSYEALRAGMYDLMRQRKQRAAFNHGYVDLKTAWEFTLVPGGSQLLFHVVAPTEPLPVTPELRKSVLATYAGGRYTLQDALDDMADVEVQRPPAQRLPAIEIWIEQQAMLRVAELEARRRHLDQEPELVATIKSQREQMLLEGAYQMAVVGVLAPGPELVRQAWERAKTQYTRVDEAHVVVVFAADTTVAGKLTREHARTASLADAARNVDAAIPVSEVTARYPTRDPVWEPLQSLFTQLQPGQWYGPEPVANGFRVLQLVDKKMSVPSMESLPAPIQQNIVGSAAEIARELRFREFTDSLSRLYRPRVDKHQLASLRWPVPAPAAAAAAQ